MKLAVSNIAWLPTHREQAYALLNENGIRGLEIAPSLFFDGAKDVFDPTPEECEDALASLRSAGLELVSMQSLLFGVEGAALFGVAAERKRFEEAMLRAIRLAGMLGIPNLVFGSPSQRVIPAVMRPEEAEMVAIEVFRRLGDASAAAGTLLGIEFNPKVYGTNFMNDAWETAAFVANINHPAIKITLDMGAMYLNGDFESMPSFVTAHASKISHVHFSEPYLAPAPADPNQAERVFQAMSAVNYGGWYSIEMNTVQDGEFVALAAAVGRLKQAMRMAEEGLA